MARFLKFGISQNLKIRIPLTGMEDKMGECCSDEKCCSTQESGDCCESENDSCCSSECCGGGDMADGLMKLADEAWGELLKEKIKKQYEKAAGPKMDKLAAVLAEGAIEYWKAKMEGTAKCAEFKEKIMQVLSE